MNKKTLLWLCVVLIIAGFTRFYHLKTTPPGLFPDEAVDGIHALHAYHTGEFQVFYKENNGEEGLFAAVDAMFISLLGGTHDAWVVRLPSAVFGFFTVLGMFFLARELFRKYQRHNLIGLLSAFFLAVSFWHINFSRIGFRAIMAPFFLVWALYFFLRSIRVAKVSWLITHATLGGIFFGLGFYSYISYRIAPLLLLLAIPFFRKHKNFWLATGIFVAATFIVAAPLGVYFLNNPADFFGRTSQVSVIGTENPVSQILTNTITTIGMLNFHGDNNWRHNLSGRPEIFWPVGVALWIGVLFALQNILKKIIPGPEQADRREIKFAHLILLCWAGLMALPVIFSNEGLPHALRGIIMIPPIMILAAVGAARIYEWLLKRFKGYAVLLNGLGLCLLIFIGITESYTYLVIWPKTPDMKYAFTTDSVRMSEYIKNISPTKAIYVVDAPDGSVPARDGWDPQENFENHSIFLQSVMFLTDTYEPSLQRAHNVHYIFDYEQGNIPLDAEVIRFR